ncbi:hypothetical protein Acel_0824 [Acidothermus cellulolyticus 11B]|uniref:Uncharacterized protein n=1 Tax=Acidothermus cellulolyticus (strain ATCC 43068 / DSM 8971 / 11B) TaxID=351607 RepID=A0LT37_ACIC1|nr:hypothetical protein Acel_0824 [Acidothermus cellulolyticus 11B]
MRLRRTAFSGARKTKRLPDRDLRRKVLATPQPQRACDSRNFTDGDARMRSDASTATNGGFPADSTRLPAAADGVTVRYARHQARRTANADAVMSQSFPGDDGPTGSPIDQDNCDPHALAVP